MSESIVSTIGQNCKRCYSCIRECPAKAIRVVDGQAVVMYERCIECGHCVKVCSQNAKKIKSDIDKVLNEILPLENTVAILAPSFAASFPEESGRLISALKYLGFARVCETAFGADLISGLYKELFDSNSQNVIISSACPAVYNYIEKYYPELVPNLAPIVSPMIALGKYLRKQYDENLKVVFIGPCIAKKSEYGDDEVENIIDAVLTFSEIKEILDKQKIDINKFEESFFDPPLSLYGKSFPLAGGLIKSADLSNDILNREIIIVEGKEKVLEIIDEIKNKKIRSKFIDILFCEGCISGPAIDSKLNYYSRREKVIDFIRRSSPHTDKKIWQSEIYNSRVLDLNRKFNPNPKRRPMPSEETIRNILNETNKYSPKDELNCGACGYPTCREYAVAIAKGLAEKDMCLPFLIDRLEKTLLDLRTTKDQLQSAEKLASIGQLAAGIAHEINNPLGTIMLYASMLKRDLEKAPVPATASEDLSLILDETARCRNIVSNLLNFARQGKLKLVKFDIAVLISKILKQFQINPQWENVEIYFNPEAADYFVTADEEQIKQLMINLITNAFEALEESIDRSVSLNLFSENEFVKIEIIDTGCGINSENTDRVFTPFFTTKCIGKGTGLGLAISYGIVKMHKGDIFFDSFPGTGTVFTVKLPKNLI